MAVSETFHTFSKYVNSVPKFYKLSKVSEIYGKK